MEQNFARKNKPIQQIDTEKIIKVDYYFTLLLLYFCSTFSTSLRKVDEVDNRVLIVLCIFAPLFLKVEFFKSGYIMARRTRKQCGGKWSLKYKKSINCKKPKGFSQKQHCKYGRTQKRFVKK